MRILILGASGMLGFQLLKFASKISTMSVFGTVRNKASLFSNQKYINLNNIFELNDIQNYSGLNEIIRKISPDVIINAIGIVKQSDLAQNSIASIEINSLLPHKLAKICQDNSAKFIHISTDCVFDGLKGNYKLTDVSNANDLYGRSKFLGEVIYGNSITLRTSIIGHEISGHNHGLLDWFLQAKSTVLGYNKAIFSGVTTFELARLIFENILPKESVSGLFQVASYPINKFDLLNIIREKYNLDIEIIASDHVQIDRSLDGTYFNQVFNYSPPTWPKMIEDFYTDWHTQSD
ncbi:dTDP-4-dehydrorhamnose reductase family protein [Aquirufa sp.]|jgi:dTDP-4-dehydrorhamnose reductase|uniref:dTDP-4-dehydrorhamnose reductase family protein n=1 Tax=Aquirufa sp. TaxID=2676249 RepID=UPI0037BFDB5F